jgi:hypothetical protein
MSGSSTALAIRLLGKSGQCILDDYQLRYKQYPVIAEPLKINRWESIYENLEGFIFVALGHSSTHWLH